jgi:hypothetical protein
MAVLLDGKKNTMWIDPDNMIVKFSDCICVLCFGVMQQPVTACPDGHSFCAECLSKEHRIRLKCPVCRFPKDATKSVVRNRPLEGIISQLRIRCEFGPTLAPNTEEASDGSDAKRGKFMSLADMTVPMLVKQLTDRSLMVSGSKASLVIRLQERLDSEQFERAKCKWVGCMDELADHNAKCGWSIVPCTTAGCLAVVQRRNIEEHIRTCTPIISCPNVGCECMFPVTNTVSHLAKCEWEEIVCPCKECSKVLFRADLKKHLTDHHMSANATAMNLHTIALRNDAMISEMNYQQNNNGHSDSWHLSTRIINWACGLQACLTREKRYSDGWGPGPSHGVFRSEPFAFDKGGKAQAFVKKLGTDSYSIGVSFVDIGVCRMHLTFALLDKNDQDQRIVWTFGSNMNPANIDFSNTLSKGGLLTTNHSEKRACTRDDGSVRFRVVIRLFRENK